MVRFNIGILLITLSFNSFSPSKLAKAQNYNLNESFVLIQAGSYQMGADLDSEYINAGKELGWRSIFIQDEFPTRNIHITQPFEISKYEITNAQYEKFDPSHKSWRGHFMNISSEDDDAVVYVSWNEANDFAKWLSENDSHYNYRLPTEAEWEYVARAGTRTPFSNGLKGNIYELNPFSDKEMVGMNYQFPYPFTWSNGCRSWVKWLPENCVGVEDVYPDKNNIKNVELKVGKTSPNNFGVYDMHGGVEEWVQDWYGPYNENDTIDPTGYSSGDFKAVRGGSHNNHVQHTRSANRMSSAINDKHYFLGFRVVRVPKSRHNKSNSRFEQPKKPFEKNVMQKEYDWGKFSSEPYFSINSLYELVPMENDGSHYGTDEQLVQFGFDPLKKKPLLTGPLYTHNHSPTITWAENGDLLISWFSGESEIGAELTLLGSRGRRQKDGSLNWTYPSEFLKAADRNMHSSNLLNNAISKQKNPESEFTLHQMASIGIAGRWDKLALGCRKSTDNGLSWSPVKMVLELDHAKNDGASMQGNMLETEDGTLIFVTDDDGDEISNTGSLVVSVDNGENWERRGHSSTTPPNKRIAGLHAAVTEVNDLNHDGKNDLIAIARDAGKYYSGKAPKSISYDGGNTWERSASEFPSIRSGQRFTLHRLLYSNQNSGGNTNKPILMTGFANDSILARNGEGEIEYIKGLYVAVSFTEGKSWPEKYRRVISNQKGSESLELTIAPWQRKNMLTRNNGQEDGYMSVTQTPDGMIYLTDGKIVYSFNLEWIIY
jgi:formylglycine-generating enzyme required for sulfatase activity